MIECHAGEDADPTRDDLTCNDSPNVEEAPNEEEDQNKDLLANRVT